MCSLRSSSCGHFAFFVFNLPPAVGPASAHMRVPVATSSFRTPVTFTFHDLKRVSVSYSTRANFTFTHSQFDFASPCRARWLLSSGEVASAYLHFFLSGMNIIDMGGFG